MLYKEASQRDLAPHVEVPAHTGAPKFSTGASTPERLRRRREEPATREEQVGGPGKLLGTRTASVVSLRFVSAFSGFETALCLNTIIPLYQKYLLVLFPEEITPTYHYQLSRVRS